MVHNFRYTASYKTLLYKLFFIIKLRLKILHFPYIEELYITFGYFYTCFINYTVHLNRMPATFTQEISMLARTHQLTDILPSRFKSIITLLTANVLNWRIAKF